MSKTNSNNQNTSVEVNTMLEPSDNVKMEVKDNILTITVDLSQNFGLSGSGKSQIIASTSGNVAISGYPSAKIGLNIYKPVRK